jgi:tetratricopeptide (TPR) repeat protein
MIGMIFFFCMRGASASLAQESLPSIVRKIMPSVFDISSYDKVGNNIRQGRGFFVSKDGDAIINRSVLEGADHADVRTIDGMLYPVRKVLAEDKEANLIRVWAEIPSSVVRPLSVSASLPQVGERVIALGKTLSFGIVSGIQEIPAFGKFIQITARISSDASISPVVNMKGEVIGVATSQKVEEQIFNFVLPSERIVKLTAGKGKTLTEWEGEREEAAESLYAKGLAFLWKEDYRKALPYFEEAAQKNLSYAGAYFQIGYCQAQLGKYVDAFEAYRKAIQIKPDFVLAHFFLGLMYLDVRDGNRALEEYRILKDLDPVYAKDLLNMIR